MKMKAEIKEAMLRVMDAESNAAAWKKEAAARMKAVRLLVQGMKAIDPDYGNVAVADIIKGIREEINLEYSPDPDQETIDGFQQEEPADCETPSPQEEAETP